MGTVGGLGGGVLGEGLWPPEEGGSEVCRGEGVQKKGHHFQQFYSKKYELNQSIDYKVYPLPLPFTFSNHSRATTKLVETHAQFVQRFLLFFSQSRSKRTFRLRARLAYSRDLHWGLSTDWPLGGCEEQCHRSVREVRVYRTKNKTGPFDQWLSFFVTLLLDRAKFIWETN